MSCELIWTSVRTVTWLQIQWTSLSHSWFRGGTLIPCRRKIYLKCIYQHRLAAHSSHGVIPGPLYPMSWLPKTQANKNVLVGNKKDWNRGKNLTVSSMPRIYGSFCLKHTQSGKRTSVCIDPAWYSRWIHQCWCQPKFLCAVQSVAERYTNRNSPNHTIFSDR